jgi:hypothetical protein
MPRVGFKPTISVLERVKKAHVLDRAPTVVGIGQSLTLFENRALRGTFGRKSVEVIEGRRKLHNKELHYLYSRQV